MAKSFSPAGMATKAYYGLGARTFGNPDGAVTGGGAYAAGGDNPNGPNQGGGGASPVLNLVINSDHIDSTGANGAGVFLSQLMTSQQQTDWNNGQFSTLNLSGAPGAPRGYWIVSGFGAPNAAAGVTGGPGGHGLIFDLDPNVPLTINIDSTLVFFYGGGSAGGGALNPTAFAGGGRGGDAIRFQTSSNQGFGQNTDININNQTGAVIGKILGGGGGAGAGSGNGGNPNFPCGGGGGAAGWLPGGAGLAAGGTANTPGNPGGVYDSNNGGTNDINVLGGAGGFHVTQGGGNGGGLGQAGQFNSLGAGFAVFRNGTPGSSTVTSGGGGNNIRGGIQ